MQNAPKNDEGVEPYHIAPTASWEDQKPTLLLYDYLVHINPYSSCLLQPTTGRTNLLDYKLFNKVSV